MKINKKYWLMSVIMILTILFPSNCYADAECEHKNRFLLTRDNRNHFFRCSDCKYDWAESHNIGEGIDYTWDFDNQTCTANGRCTVCNYVVSETADATATVVQEKSCTLPELTTYSVTFGNSAFGIQTKENVQTAEATGHDLEAVEKKEASCTEDGYEAYWKCNTCEKLFSDEAGTVEINNRMDIPATGHSYGVVTYTWNTDNQKCTAERKCTVCDNAESETADATATVVQEKSCTLPELTTYSVTFGNSAFGIQTKENVQTAEATGHDLKAVKRKDAGCTEAGYEAYWRCQTCKKLFSDAAGTVEISNPTVIKATGHNLKKVEKKDATATEEGNSTYWFCDKCNKYFSDAKAETEIKKEDTVLAKLSTVNKKETEASSAKTANATKVTSTTDKTTKSSPKTGDSTDVQLYVILMLVSIGAAAGAGAKRKLKTQR